MRIISNESVYADGYLKYHWVLQILLVVTQGFEYAENLFIVCHALTASNYIIDSFKLIQISL